MKDQPQEPGLAPLALIESLFWQDGYARLERHLARISSSAAALGLNADPGQLRSALLESARSLPAGEPHKVRLLLSANGSELEATPLAGPPAEAAVLLAAERVDSRDLLLQHKTTRRSLFDLAGATADKLGIADLLFLNERGQLTEGSRHNVFIERNGRLLTSPLGCGLLPGVFRQTVLESRSVLLRPLTLPDLQTADKVFLTNSVRGCRQVRFAGRVSAS